MYITIENFAFFADSCSESRNTNESQCKNKDM